jgi:hypothetical protein
MLIPLGLQQMAGGDWDGGWATADEPIRIGEEFGDDDLTWLARDEVARALLRGGAPARAWPSWRRSWWWRTPRC